MIFIVIAAIIIVIACIPPVPSRKDIFEISRIGCRYVNWMPRYGATGKLNLTCQLASAPLDAEERIKCTLDNCPIVNEHMKGKRSRTSQPGPLTEGKTKTTMKPVGEGLDVMPTSPPPAPKPSGIRCIKEGEEKPKEKQP